MAAHKHRVLVVFVDAFGAAQMARLGTGLAALSHRRVLDGVLGYSSGALATVLTGAPPSDHGRMCLFSHKPTEEASILEPLRFLGLLPKLLHERTKLRHYTGRVFAKAMGLTGYVALHRVPPEHFPWLDLPEREDIFQADDLGGEPTFLADARRAGLSVYAAPWQMPEEERWHDALSEIRRLKPDLAFLYATELDGKLHTHGNRAEVIEDVLTRVGQQIDRAREAMAEDGAELTTLVVGDHGMADVHRTIDPRAAIKEIGGRLFVDSTMMRLWGSGAHLERAKSILERHRTPGKWLDAQALSQREAPMTNSPYGDAFFLLDEGVIFAPSFVGGRVAGMHGYDIHDTSARAALISDHPIPESCTSLKDVAGLVRKRLELGT